MHMHGMKIKVQGKSSRKKFIRQNSPHVSSISKIGFSRLISIFFNIYFYQCRKESKYFIKYFYFKKSKIVMLRLCHFCSC